MKRILNLFVLFTFVLNTILPYNSHAAVLPYMPAVGTMIKGGENYSLPQLVGMRFSSDSPFKFTFILSGGNVDRNEKTLRVELAKIHKYFLAALTIPEKDLWVNLSPYEQNRITPDILATTELGQDLLGEDYVLKQLAASLTHPDTQTGEEYWAGTKNDLTKIWIIPEKIKVLESSDRALIDIATLTVKSDGISNNALLPAIKKEVNEGKQFAQLRQIYSVLIMASWFKKKLKDTILNEQYFGKGKLANAKNDDPAIREKIYNEYLKAFNQGVYNIVKTDSRLSTLDFRLSAKRKRSYFCGGMNVTTVGSEVAAGLTSATNTHIEGKAAQITGGAIEEELAANLQGTAVSGLENTVAPSAEKQQALEIWEQKMRDYGANRNVSALNTLFYNPQFKAGGSSGIGLRAGFSRSADEIIEFAIEFLQADIVKRHQEHYGALIHNDRYHPALSWEILPKISVDNFNVMAKAAMEKALFRHDLRAKRGYRHSREYFEQEWQAAQAAKVAEQLKFSLTLSTSEGVAYKRWVTLAAQREDMDRALLQVFDKHGDVKLPRGNDTSERIYAGALIKLAYELASPQDSREVVFNKDYPGRLAQALKTVTTGTLLRLASDALQEAIIVNRVRDQFGYVPEGIADPVYELYNYSNDKDSTMLLATTAAQVVQEYFSQGLTASLKEGLLKAIVDCLSSVRRTTKGMIEGSREYETEVNKVIGVGLYQLVNSLTDNSPYPGHGTAILHYSVSMYQHNQKIAQIFGGLPWQLGYSAVELDLAIDRGSADLSFQQDVHRSRLDRALDHDANNDEFDFVWAIHSEYQDRGELIAPPNKDGFFSKEKTTYAREVLDEMHAKLAKRFGDEVAWRIIGMGAAGRSTGRSTHYQMNREEALILSDIAQKMYEKRFTLEQRKGRDIKFDTQREAFWHVVQKAVNNGTEQVYDDLVTRVTVRRDGSRLVFSVVARRDTDEAYQRVGEFNISLFRGASRKIADETASKYALRPEKLSRALNDFLWQTALQIKGKKDKPGEFWQEVTKLIDVDFEKRFSGLFNYYDTPEEAYVVLDELVITLLEQSIVPGVEGLISEGRRIIDEELTEYSRFDSQGLMTMDQAIDAAKTIRQYYLDNFTPEQRKNDHGLLSSQEVEEIFPLMLQTITAGDADVRMKLEDKYSSVTMVRKGESLRFTVSARNDSKGDYSPVGTFTVSLADNQIDGGMKLESVKDQEVKVASGGVKFSAQKARTDIGELTGLELQTIALRF